MDEQKAAITNRSLRTIRTELEYLTDASVISPEQLANFLSLLPQQTILHAPISSPAPTPAPSQTTPDILSSPPVNQIANQLNNASLNEKQGAFAPPSPTPAPVPPPPAYAASPAVATASALYEYHPTDAGDLAISPNDRIIVTEFMNADWAKGRNERTGLEGIFPRAYVAIVDEKNKMASPPPLPLQQQPSGYGNMPMEVAQGQGQGQPGGPFKQSKFNEQGKKFGKKMGNAAIFGAGATIGSNIVNGIF